MSYTIILFMLLITAIKVQAECQKPFVGENRVFTADSAQQTFPDGATLKFKCSPGYISVERRMSRSITCNGTDWSKLQLQCQKRSCGLPGEIVNGKYLLKSPDGILFGAVITAECDEGYLMFGPETRTCREKGWDLRPPECEPVHCTKPPHITNGWFKPKKIAYDYDKSISYFCKQDFILFGPSWLTCSANGSFQPDPPRCLLVICERPAVSYAYRIEDWKNILPYRYGHTNKYTCIEGYKMEGSQYVTCTEKGWVPALPRCNVITCKNPPNLNNGTFDPIKEVYEYKEKVTYSCKEGYRISKASSISCTLYGTFKPLLSQCLAITCEKPNIINGYIIEGESTSYKYNSVVRFQCNSGYTMGGNDHMTCKESGWDPTPQCHSSYLFWVLSAFGLAVLCVIVGCCCCQKNEEMTKCFTPKERSDDICNSNQPIFFRVPIVKPTDNSRSAPNALRRLVSVPNTSQTQSLASAQNYPLCSVSAPNFH